MSWLYARVLLTLVSGQFENSDNEPTSDMWSLIVNTEWLTVTPKMRSEIDIQVGNSKARLSNWEMNFASQIYVGGNARAVVGYWNWGLDGLYRSSKWAAWGLVKAPLGPTSLLGSTKWSWKPIFSVPIKHFGTSLASILEHFSYLFCTLVFRWFLLPFGVGLGVHLNCKSLCFVKDII